jgi:hypothetical protein
MNDMRSVIVPKSDQLNADELIGGPITVTIREVTIRPGTEQPVSIHFENDNGKPYKPCKSMARVMVQCWGPDASQYTGRSMTLYRDPGVKWGGMAVGGIRISHMTDIKGAQTMALTETKGSKKLFTVKPLVMEMEPAGPSPELVAAAEVAASKGVAAYQTFWKALTKPQKNALLPEHERLKGIATAADEAAASATGDSAEDGADIPFDAETPPADDAEFPGDRP